ncbi:hypothetical protein [Flavobacterium sp.]|jgi:hypothetical protein
MINKPFTKEEFKFCYRALFILWRARDEYGIREAKRSLNKMRGLYSILHG